MTEKFIGPSFVRREILPRYKFKVGETVTQEYETEDDYWVDNGSPAEHFYLLGKVDSRYREKHWGSFQNFYKVRYEDRKILSLAENNAVRVFWEPYKFKLNQKVRIRENLHAQMNQVNVSLEPHLLIDSAEIRKRQRRSSRGGARRNGLYGLTAYNQYILQWEKNDSSYLLDEREIEATD